MSENMYNNVYIPAGHILFCRAYYSSRAYFSMTLLEILDNSIQLSRELFQIYAF